MWENHRNRLSSYFCHIDFVCSVLIFFFFLLLVISGLTLATGGYDMCVCLWDVDNNVQKLKLQVLDVILFG